MQPVALSRRTIAAVVAGVTVAAGLTGAVVLASDSGGSDGSTPSGGSGGQAVDDDVRTVQPGAPGEPGRELTDEELAAVEAPGHTAVDTAFMQAMLAHHAQALEMTGLVAERTDTDETVLLAERITISQEAEIELIEQWLTDRGEAVPDPEHHEQHASMRGMATPDQLTALGAARGPAFDAQFLRLMIAHHQGAVTMVEELYDSGGGVEPAADSVARGVEADQSIEILRMTDMLTARGG